MPFVYIVRCADGTLYTGWALDVPARVKVHNAGRGARYTRARRPVRLLYSEELPTHTAAMRRERQLKKLPRARKLALARAAKQTKAVRSRRARKTKTV